MSRYELLEWMDAVAPLWTGEDYHGQMFIDRWWWTLCEVLKDELTAYSPMMVYKIYRRKAKALTREGR